MIFPAGSRLHRSLLTITTNATLPSWVVPRSAHADAIDLRQDLGEDPDATDFTSIANHGCDMRTRVLQLRFTDLAQQVLYLHMQFIYI
jgi:hypothetical protein